jgi:hypothetical protein
MSHRSLEDTEPHFAHGRARVLFGNRGGAIEADL